jgi:hypothetical protein
MLGAKPPSSPTLVASCPYFFLITDWKKFTEEKIDTTDSKVIQDNQMMAQTRRELLSGCGKLQHPSS